jgi:hypothetical protein
LLLLMLLVGLMTMTTMTTWILCRMLWLCLGVSGFCELRFLGCGSLAKKGRTVYFSRPYHSCCAIGAPRVGFLGLFITFHL